MGEKARIATIAATAPWMVNTFNGQTVNISNPL
jgi:hypothetical protein